MNKVTTQERARYYEYRKSNIEHSERKSINTRGVWQFDISLDTLLKENSKMVQSMDKERAMGIIKHEKSIVDFFTGAGTGIIVSCLCSPDSLIRTTAIIVGITMIGIGWYKKSKSDKKVFQYMKEQD